MFSSLKPTTIEHQLHPETTQVSNSKMELESLTPSRIDKVVKYNGSYLQWLARDKEFRTQ